MSLCRVLTFAGALVILSALPVMSAATLYDNFSVNKLNPAKWIGSWNSFGPGASMELQRKVSAGELMMTHRIVGGNTTNDGIHQAANQLLFKTPPITGVEMAITVTKAATVGCSADGDTTSANPARYFGALFSQGGNDVFAGFELFRLSTDPATKLRVVGSMSQDGDFIGTVDLGMATIGTPVAMRMIWDSTANRVDFQRGSNPIQSVTYVIDDSTPPITPFAVIESLGFVPNCTSANRPLADVAAKFDNVLVNP